ncbi:RagB/SusD family nutrient uptake outer membrane protein [Rapidithrix thailandica]|uniref:RagB/SusD family nutrient uptake outer membrane protein n=1 Tax=Rapidithrix thailandica TaxID=413964 RepID=A0AAW9SI09_9BACT
MKYIKYLLVGILLNLASCSGFLDEDPATFFSPENYYTKPEHAQAAVNAAYSYTLNYYTASGTYAGTPHFMLEFLTGQAITKVGQNQSNHQFIGLSYNNDNEYIRNWWQISYYGVHASNLVLKYVPGISMNEGDKNRNLAEAHFLRAFYYFNLVRLFGEAPLLIEPIEDLGSAQDAEKASQEEIYELIVEDLKAAENTASLPDTDRTGRVSKLAVKSLLAKVYLTMAGYPLQKNGYYKLAADKAKEVIESNQYALFDEYGKLHNKAFENMGEHIFMAQFYPEIQQHLNHAYTLPFQMDISIVADEFGALLPEEEFYNSYAAGDKRVEEQQFFYTEFTPIAGKNKGKKVTFGYPAIFKHFDFDAENTARQALNYPILRYADVLLIYAEAQNEVGRTALAEQSLQEIRERAGFVGENFNGLSQSEFREAVWRERNWELCYENQTWFDMLRTRKAFNVKTKAFDDFVGHINLSSGKALQANNLLLPVPERETNINPDLKN